MKIRLFANYGVLAHESHPVFTAAHPEAVPDSRTQNELYVEWPDEYEPYETVVGELAAKIDGLSYTLNELLTNIGDDPAMFLPGHYSGSPRRLKVVEP